MLSSVSGAAEKTAKAVRQLQIGNSDHTAARGEVGAGPKLQIGKAQFAAIFPAAIIW